MSGFRRPFRNRLQSPNNKASFQYPPHQKRAPRKKNFFIIQALFKKSEEHLRVKNNPLAYSLFFSLLLIIKKEVSPREGKILLFEINLKLKK